MKRLSGKFIVSALLAAALISTSAVSAGAYTDYANPGRGGGTGGYGGGIISTGGSSTTDSSTTSETTGNTGTEEGDGSDVQGGDEQEEETPGSSEDSPVTSVSDDTIKDLVDSGESEATIFIEENSNGSITVKKDAIGEIAGGDTVVTFVNDEDGYAVTIDPKLITDVKAINIAMDVSVTGSKGEEIGDVEIPAHAIVIAPKQKGDFGMTLKVTITADSIDDLGLDTDNLHLYYVSDDGKVTDMTSSLSVNNGSVSIMISHASEYVITDHEMEIDFVDDSVIGEEEEESENSDFEIIIDLPSEEGEEESEGEPEEDDNGDSDEDAGLTESDNGFAEETPVEDEPQIADSDTIGNDDINVGGNEEAAPTTDKGKTETPSSTEGGLIVDAGTDANPVTGTEFVFGALAVTAFSALAIAATSKKRK